MKDYLFCLRVCVCVCVRERERERERDSCETGDLTFNIQCQCPKIYLCLQGSCRFISALGKAGLIHMVSQRLPVVLIHEFPCRWLPPGRELLLGSRRGQEASNYWADDSIRWFQNKSANSKIEYKVKEQKSQIKHRRMEKEMATHSSIFAWKTA